MKFLLISFSVLATIFLLQACTNSKYSVEKLSEKQIRWGTGGGFAGKESTHILCDNGQIFKRDIVGVTTKYGKTKEKKAKELFKTIESLELSKAEFTHPGNTYSFLEWQDGDMVSRVVWGDKSFPVEKPIEDLYGSLNGLLKK